MNSFSLGHSCLGRRVACFMESLAMPQSPACGHCIRYEDVILCPQIVNTTMSSPGPAPYRFAAGANQTMRHWAAMLPDFFVMRRAGLFEKV